MRRLALSLLLVFSAVSIAYAGDYVGSEACKTCHEAEYQQWKSTGHANALIRLSSVQQKNLTCRRCHTMDPAAQEAQLVGVQCETCHGPGLHYSQRYVMRDKELSRLLGLRDIDERTCVLCHTQDGPSLTPFVFKDRVQLVMHKKNSGDER